MKKIIPFFLLLILSASSFSQQTKPAPSLIKKDYLAKSKKQKTAAWILLSGGGVLMTTAILIPDGEVTSRNYSEFFYSETHKNDRLKTAIGLTGLFSMLGSTPFFIASSKNKKRAASLSFSNQKIPSFQKSSFVYHSIPSLKLKISL